MNNTNTSRLLLGKMYTAAPPLTSHHEATLELTKNGKTYVVRLQVEHKGRLVCTDIDELMQDVSRVHKLLNENE